MVATSGSFELEAVESRSRRTNWIRAGCLRQAGPLPEGRVDATGDDWQTSKHGGLHGSMPLRQLAETHRA